MRLIWDELREAVPMILHGNPTLFSVIGFTLQVAAGRDRGRDRDRPADRACDRPRAGSAAGNVLRVLANASLALPPVLVGAFLFVLFLPQAPLGSLQLIWTRRVVFIAQTILALPFVVALTAAAVQGLPPGLLAQARLLGAGRRQLWTLALREARIGVMAAVIAALGTSLSEVAAVAILGGNIYGYDQTLASATLYEVNGGYYADAVAIAIVLIVLILILMCGLGMLQHQGNGIRLRFRSAT